MTEWISTSLEKLADFFIKHSSLFKSDNRVLVHDALITTGQLYAIIEYMKFDPKFDFIEVDFLNNIQTRVKWIYTQLLINYRINLKEYIELKDDNNRFFEVTPTGEVRVDQRIYNIPKHLDEIGVYPDLSTGTWIKEIDYGEREWDR